MNDRRKLSLRRESLSDLTRHELQSVAGADAQCISCHQCETWVLCGGGTIATCLCPTGATCVCPTEACL